MNPKRPKKNDGWLIACVKDVCGITNAVKGKNWETITHADLRIVLNKLSSLVSTAHENAPKYRAVSVTQEADRINRAVNAIVDIQNGEAKGNIDEQIGLMQTSAETLKNFLPELSAAAS